MVIQLSIFVRNKPGELKKVTEMIKNQKISILALTVAETADYGILRIIVNDPEKCFELLHENDILVGKTEIFGVELKDSINGLNSIAGILGEKGVNIEYMYMLPKKEKTILMIQVSNEHENIAIDAFNTNSIKIYQGSEIYE